LFISAQAVALQFVSIERVMPFGSFQRAIQCSIASIASSSTAALWQALITERQSSSRLNGGETGMSKDLEIQIIGQARAPTAIPADSRRSIPQCF
jgi:hypothetical protein